MTIRKSILSLKAKSDFIKDLFIFSGVNADVLGELAGAMTVVEILKGTGIIRKGEKGDALYIIARGKVRIHDGNHVLARMEHGEMFGEYSLIDENTRSASVTAEENCLLLKLSRSDFYRIASGNSEILRGVLHLHIRRMRDMNDLEEKLSRSYLKIRRQKEQIEKQSNSISAQKEQLVQQNFDLTRLNEEKNQLISTVIHQIKNPLSSSLCMAEMLEADKDRLTEEQSVSLSIMRNSLRRINNLLNQFLDINAIDSKVYKLRMENLNLKEITEELIDTYRYFIEQKNIRLFTEIDAIEAMTNRVYFTQIIDNLLSNAVKFTYPEKSIHVRLEKTNDRIIFTIRDEGPGIEKELLAVIFDQYTRQTDMFSQDLPPHGLGLAIVRKYVMALNGTIQCMSEPGKGSTFTVEIGIKD